MFGYRGGCRFCGGRGCLACQGERERQDRKNLRRALRTLEQDGVITPLMRQVVRELEEYSHVR